MTRMPVRSVASLRVFRKFPGEGIGYNVPMEIALPAEDALSRAPSCLDSIIFSKPGIGRRRPTKSKIPFFQ